MLRIFFFYTFFGLFFTTVQAQNADCTIKEYERLMAEGRRLSQIGEYDNAISKFQSAKVCQPKKETEVGREILIMFKKVNGERDKAEKNLAKSNRLIHHFNFNNEAAAWTYKNGKFAVINLNGDTLTDFIYENPEVFSHGNAIAINKNQFVIINKYGKEVSPHYSYLIKTEKKSYYAGRYDGADILDSNKRVMYFYPNAIFAREYNDRFNENFIAMNTQYKIVQKGNYFGVIDSLDRKIIDFKYDYIRFFSDKTISVRKDGRWGIINLHGDIILNIDFNLIGFISNNLFKVKNNKKWGIIDDKGRLFVDYKFDWIGELSEGLLQVTMNNKYGYVDLTGMEIVPFKYDHISTFSEGLALAKLGKEWSCLNRYGQQLFVLKGDYDAVQPFHNGFSSVRKSNNWGLIDKLGNEVFPPQCLNMISVENGLAVVNINKNYSIIDTAGKFIIDTYYQYLYGTQDGFFIAKSNDKWGVLNSKGEEIVPVEYENIFANHDRYIFIKTAGGWGIKLKTGVELTKSIYLQINTFPNGEVFVQTKDGWELLDSSCNRMSLQKFLYITEFVKNGLAEAQKNNKWGYIDSLGRTITAFNIDSSSTYFQDLFAMCGSLGLHDENIRNEFRAYLEPVINGFQRSIIKYKYGIIDPNGKIVLPFEFSEIYPAGYHIFLTQQNELTGLFAPDLGIYIDPEYSQFGFIDEEFGWIRAQKNGKWGWIDRNGKEMIPIRYDIVTPFKNGKALVQQAPYPGFFYINKLGEMILSSPN